jgi:hypothetical protein
VPEATNAYVLPDDPLEGERLNIQHRLLREGMGNHLAPIGRPRAVLELAREFPDAQVETFDKDLLNLRQAYKRLRKLNQWPTNFHFWGQETDSAQVKFGPDMLGRWPYEDNAFEYVHARFINPGIPLRFWPHVLSEMLRVTRPGGWIELVEGQLATCDVPGYREIEAAIVRLAHARLGYYNPGPHLQSWLSEAGAVRVEEKLHVLGTGSTSQLQPLIAEDMQQGFQSIGPVLLEHGFITKERYDACMYSLLGAILEAGSTLPIWVVYGQKTDASHS